MMEVSSTVRVFFSAVGRQKHKVGLWTDPRSHLSRKKDKYLPVPACWNRGVAACLIEIITNWKSFGVLCEKCSAVWRCQLVASGTCTKSFSDISVTHWKVNHRSVFICRRPVWVWLWNEWTAVLLSVSAHGVVSGSQWTAGLRTCLVSPCYECVNKVNVEQVAVQTDFSGEIKE